MNMNSPGSSPFTLSQLGLKQSSSSGGPANATPFYASPLYTEPAPVYIPHLTPLCYRINLSRPAKESSSSSAADSDAADEPSRPVKVDLPPTSIQLPQTPGILPTTPGPSQPPCSPAIPPWRIRWACYALASGSQDSIPSANSITSKTHVSPSIAGTPVRSGTTIAGSNRPSGATPTQNDGPRHLATSQSDPIGRLKDKGRSRSDSSVSSSSKKPRFTTHTISHVHNPLYDPEQPISRFLNGIKSRASSASSTASLPADPFKLAKNAYLDAESADDDDSAQADLPLRMSYIEAEGSPDMAAGITRHLWLFSTSADQRDSAADTFGSYADLEMTSSGSFSCQDLFPALYNDNSIYTAPSSRPARLYASCLQLSTNVNGEAVKASATFLLAVRQRLLNQSLEKCKPGHAAKGVLCGDGLVWPSTSEDTSSPCAKSAVYLSYDLHFDYLGIVASAFLHPVSLVPVSIPGPPTKRRKLHAGDAIVLCPLALPATFVRWYGVESQEQPSAKVAAREKASIESMRQAFADTLEHEASDVSAEDIWMLVRIGDMEIGWPASFTLVQSICDKTLATDEPEVPENKTCPVILPTSRDLIPRNKRIEHLADITSAHIESQGKERERERKERAQRQLASQQDKQIPLDGSISTLQSTPAATPASIDSSQQIDNGASSMALDTPYDNSSAQPAIEPGQSAPVRKLRKSKVHTLASLAARLPPPRKRSSPEVQSAAAEARKNSHTQLGKQPADQMQLYPTPLSMSTSVSSEALLPASASQASQQFPNTQETKYTDFSWNSYDNSLNSHTPFGSTDVFADNTFMFEDDGNNMFADNGLTEDDFSFFDNPALPLALPEHTLPPTNSQDLMPLEFTNSNAPIDHFGHLMPTGDSPASAAILGTSPTFLDHPTPSTVSSTKPSSTATFAIESPFTSVFSASPLFLTDYPVQKPVQPTILEPSDVLPTTLPEDVPPLIQPHSKYAIRAHPGDDKPGPSSSLCRDCAFDPIAFVEHPTNATRYAGLEYSPHTDQVPLARRLIQIHYDAKARALQAQLKRGNLGCRKSRPRRCWVASTTKRPDLLYDDSSDSDLSEADTPTQVHHVDAALHSVSHFGSFEGFPACKLTLLLQSRNLVARLVPLKNDIALGLMKTSGGGRASKGEKEAVATVFFQQVAENPHFRKRMNIVKARQLSTSPGISHAHIALNKLVAAVSLEAIPPTSIGVICHSAIMKMSASSLNFWNKIGLKPYNGPKDVRVILLAASSIATDEVQSAIEPWLQDLSTAYQAANLGTLSYLSKASEANGPLFTLESGLGTLSEITSLQEKLQAATSSINQDLATASHAAAYILVNDEECHNPSSTLIYVCLRVCLIRKGLIPQILPLSLLARRLSSGWDTSAPERSLVDRLAMTLYDRLGVGVERFTAKRLEVLAAATVPSAQNSRMYPAPAFKLISTRKQICTFTTHWPPPTLEITQRHRIFHVAYAFSSDNKWLLLSAMDDEGEYSAVRARHVDGLELKIRLRRVWSFAKETSESVNVEWRICITKAGHMPLNELQAWNESLPGLAASTTRPMHVTLGCIGEGLPVAPALLPSVQDEARQEGIFCSNTAIKATFSDQPTAIYESVDIILSGLPKARKPAYYALSSSWLHYIPKQISQSPLLASRSYSYHILLSCAHPLSGFPQTLATHLRDVTKSYMDLQTLARERWTLGVDGSPDSCLPWHLSVIRLLIDFELESLFQ